VLEMKRETFKAVSAKTGKPLREVLVLTPENANDIRTLNEMLAAGKIQPQFDPKSPREGR
jgi:hypothetical protein